MEKEKIIYDSTENTLKHKHRVLSLLKKAQRNLKKRGAYHDNSKLKSLEKEVFDIYTQKLKNTTYMSDEYKKYMEEMKKALDKHYQENDHHPEHFEKGIQDMNLLQLIEMLMDWKASSERHADGDIFTSIEKNQERFDYSDELKQIFINTINYMEGLI